MASGWYSASVQVTDIANNITWAGPNIKFGVGDSYLIAGQSNARGFPEIWDQGLISFDNSLTDNNLPSGVRVLNGFKPKVNEEVVRTNNAAEANKKQRYVVSNGMPYFHSLEKLTLNHDMDFEDINWFERPIYSNGMASWCWAPLGKRLVNSSTDVPVQFFNFAIDNSSIGHWQKTPISLDPPGLLGAPIENHYKTLSDFISFQGNILGFRGILWHQGERDVTDGTSNSDYKNRLEGLMNNVQNDFDPWQTTVPPMRIWKPVNWVISKVGYSTDNGNPPSIITNDPTNIKGAQISATPQTNGSNKFAGIDSDIYSVSTRAQSNKIHFTGSTHGQIGQLWKDVNLVQGNTKDSQSFLFPITISHNQGSNTYTLTPPFGYTNYFWVRNEKSISDPSTQQKTNPRELIINSDESIDRVIYTCYIKNPSGSKFNVSALCCSKSK
ncbi:MAG: hypothetical protein ACI9K1_000387 [Arcticibacterium sp.]